MQLLQGGIMNSHTLRNLVQGTHAGEIHSARVVTPHENLFNSNSTQSNRIIQMKQLTKNFDLPYSNNPNTVPLAPDLKGFPKVVVDGSFIRVDDNKPFYARMVSRAPNIEESLLQQNDAKHKNAVLESVTCNLEAGVDMLNSQENSLAKIGGRLASIALSLNKIISSNATESNQADAQVSFEESRNKIREITQVVHDHVALFSNGPSAPIAIAVPVLSSWEGLSISRCDISTPGLQSLDKGKVFGKSDGFFLDYDSVKRAFHEWRKLCTTNRLQWGLLRNHIRWIKNSMNRLHSGGKWNIPPIRGNTQNGPLNRPHRNN
jgi:hypothetical protein